ncbi:hypothetical protein CJ030_MR2G012433 [Morella rubra]|uniref:Uncharacterized protein n=1 Tax=Morella rubra TaxID=262757 RepID=A0A6A1WGE1_9ROSI|nr:hypothetical protein CJ030_MR2G012433 [Morella rubra]
MITPQDLSEENAYKRFEGRARLAIQEYNHRFEVYALRRNGFGKVNLSLLSRNGLGSAIWEVYDGSKYLKP